MVLVTWALVIRLICMPSALGPAALGHTYQANPSRPCYNYYMDTAMVLLTTNGITGFILPIPKYRDTAHP